jgi:hypothetical protein
MQADTWVDRMNGLHNTGSQLGHGEVRNSKDTEFVHQVQVPSSSDDEEPWRFTQSDDWSVRSVSCGFDHTCTVLEMRGDKALWRL